MNWLLKFGSQLRMEELHRLRELAEGRSQCANQTLAEKSSTPASVHQHCFDRHR